MCRNCISRAQFRNPSRKMSYAESPVETIAKFIPSWTYTNPQRLEQEIISSFNETNRKPDNFRLKYKNGNIVDFETEQPVKIDRSSYLGRMDGELFDVLGSWISENDQGTALWISPSYDTRYPCNKITIYQIESAIDKEKIMMNVSILFDTPKNHTLEIAAKINPYFIKETDPEILRNKLFQLNDGLDLDSVLKMISANGIFPPTPSQEVIRYFVDRIYSGFDPRRIAQEMQERGVIGKFSISCGGGSFVSNFMDKSSLTLNFSGIEDRFGSLDFACPHCGALNSRPLGQLISNCQHCGADVRC